MRLVENPDMQTSRRALLKVATAVGGGLLVGFLAPVGLASEPKTSGGFAPNAFIRIDQAGKVTLIMPQVEMGQGTYTSISMILAEELDADWASVAVQHAPPDTALYANPVFGVQATGNSNSIRAFWTPLRKAGAGTRLMLVDAAASGWGVDPASCRTEASQVIHDPTGRRASYRDLVGRAAGLKPPADPALKAVKDFRLIGKPLKRLDTPDKVNGQAQYGIDALPPGVTFATLAHAPVFGGKVGHADDTQAKLVPGVRQVVVLDDLVAVVGDHMWAAKQGLAALDVTWNDGPHADITTQQVVDRLVAASSRKGAVAKSVGDVGKALGSGAIEATYRVPFLAHATMEPLNCTVHVTPTSCEVWVGIQVVARAQEAAAKITGLPLEKVTVNNHLLGGGFGRRLETDFVSDAVRIGQHVEGPVKVVWTREEDIQHDVYRPAWYDRMSAQLDGDRISGWKHIITGSSVLSRWLPPAVHDDMDFDAYDSAADMPYDIPNLHVEYVREEPPGVPTGFWRGVGPAHNVFVIESFIDELAHKAGKDPVAFRLAMLDKAPRLQAALRLAADKTGWGSPLPPRCGRGVSVQPSFASWIATVVEVEVDDDGGVNLRNIVCAVDTGIAVNPDTIAAQLQGGIIFGLTAALYGEITVAGGRVQQSNFHDYRMLRIDQTPPIDIHVIPSGEAPGGIGEAGTVSASAALTNAIFAATGKRLRQLPVDRDVLAGRDSGMKLGRLLLIVVAVVAVVGLGVTAWLVTASRPLAFAGGHSVTLADYKGPSPTGIPADFMSADPIARGQYLTRAADCQACHTAKGGAPFGGGLAFNLPFGTIWSPNITPDKANGIGGWSDAQFIRAVRQGVDDQGQPLYPAMPYGAFTYMTDADVLAIKAYLFSLPPAAQADKDDSLSFPFNQRFLMVIWRGLFAPDQRFAPHPDRSPQWNRGAYLAEAMAHCGDCHTPRSLGQSLDNRSKYAGAVAAGWKAYNITGHRLSGVGAWSDAELAQYLATGHAEGRGTAAGPMGEAVDLSLSHLTASDIGALVAYLRSIPAISTPDQPAAMTQPAPAAPKLGVATGFDPKGKHIFEGACASCHSWTGQGSLNAWATLTGVRAVNDPTATNVAQVIISGANRRTATGLSFMPAFGHAYSDDEIAAVANYVTARFGAKGSSVSPKQVASLRKAAS